MTTSVRNIRGSAEERGGPGKSERKKEEHREVKEWFC